MVKLISQRSWVLHSKSKQTNRAPHKIHQKLAMFYLIMLVNFQVILVNIEFFENLWRRSQHYDFFLHKYSNRPFVIHVTMRIFQIIAFCQKFIFLVTKFLWMNNTNPFCKQLPLFILLMTKLAFQPLSPKWRYTSPAKNYQILLTKKWNKNRATARQRKLTFI